MISRLPILIHCAAAVAVAFILAGCSAPALGTEEVAHGDGVALDSSAVHRWAEKVAPDGYAAGPGADIYTDPSTAIGPAAGSNAGVVVLGSGGSITLDMGEPFADTAGADLAVWENGLSGPDGMLFAELAFVEVSSDGQNFARFPVSTERQDPVSGYDTAFGYIDPDQYSGFAGLHPVSTGTAFDLTELNDAPLTGADSTATVDLSAIRYVRIVDVIGDGRERDAHGREIYDPYPTVNPDTDRNTAGFDLDGVAVLR